VTQEEDGARNENQYGNWRSVQEKCAAVPILTRVSRLKTRKTLAVGGVWRMIIDQTGVATATPAGPGHQRAFTGTRAPRE